MDEDIRFHDSDALLFRLSDALRETEKEVVFVVGAPLTAPYEGGAGVADVNGVISLIRNEFSGKSSRLARLERDLDSSDNKYQAAFNFLSGYAGPDVSNRVIRKAVIQAISKDIVTDKFGDSIAKLSSSEVSSLDKDISVWNLSPGVDALGHLIARFPDRFGQMVVTSNFDPLIEIAIKRHDGQAWRTSLSNDGSVFNSTASGCQVVHIHGYWHSSDTLHTRVQLLRTRPKLMSDLLKILEDKIVVVLAYGGWPDIFTVALSDAIENNNLLPEVLWAFFSENPTLPDHLQQILLPGVARGRVALYSGVDCHTFLPALAADWNEYAPIEDAITSIDNKVSSITAGLATDERPLFRLAPLDCDRPPNVEVWVGREEELRALEVSRAKVTILCGLGGEGKSVLAGYYVYNLSERDSRYCVWDWRDCKEQSDRIRTQVSESIIRLSNASFSSENLGRISDEDLVEIFVNVTRASRAVIVFDNVDSYVDLENRIFTGLLQKIVLAFSASDVSSRLLLTCRPEVEYASSSIITIKVSGIALDEAINLFRQRVFRIEVPHADIEEAHRQTQGHAFELDLIASQMNVPGTTLNKLLDDMRRGRGGRPDVLSSIWDKLPLREQTLLRYLAESIRPETEETIQKFCSARLTFKNFTKAFANLKSLNLVVIKQEQDAPDLYDLHPLVRHFVRTKFERDDRSSFIKSVLQQYESIIGVIGSLIGIQLPYSLLERWSQKVELQVSLGLYESAFDTLLNLEDSMIGGGHLQEFIRVSRILFESIDWETAASKYKQFDKLVYIVSTSLEQLGDAEAADRLLYRYEETVPQKTARYIHLCDLKAYVFWLRGDFDSATDWAAKGDALKEGSQVDTNFDCKHTLALAQRDSGEPEEALEYFVKEHELTDLLQPDALPVAEATTYGNVGRCLQIMGRLDDALICYRQSLKLLEEQTYSTTRSNRAYARHWIGQIYIELKEPKTAAAFLIDGIRILGSSAPSRVRSMIDDLNNALEGNSFVMNEISATRIVRSWLK